MNRLSLLFFAAAILSGIGQAQTVDVLDVATLAGSPVVPGLANGTGGAARFNHPYAVAVNAQGNVYVADSGNNVIRMVTPQGVVTTVAGTGAAGSADGPAASASFDNPCGLAVDKSGSIFVSDTSNNTIREISAAGNVTTVAGTAGVSGAVDGMGTAALLALPVGLAFDSAGNLYVMDQGNSAIRKISPDFGVTTLVSSQGGPFGGPSSFWNAVGIGVDVSGDVYIANGSSNNILEVTPQGVVSVVAGSLSQAYGLTDGPASTALFATPAGLAIDSQGNTYVTDGTETGDIRMITPAGEVSTIAGGPSGFADGLGGQAEFDGPEGIAVDPSGNFYIADTFNSTIRAARFVAAQLPAVTAGPSVRTVGNGATVTLTGSAASGTPPFTYQWYFEGKPLEDGSGISGSTTTMLILSDVPDTVTGSYTLQATNGAGSGMSPPVQVTVVEPPPVITVQPQNVTTTDSGPATFSVTAFEGDTYQWFYNGVPIASPDGANGPTLALTNLAPSMDGLIWVTVSNLYGSVTSAQVQLTVLPTPVVNTGDSPSGDVGIAFSVQLQASGSPTSFAVSGLPQGLTLNSATGVISGYPEIAGSYPISVTATNSYGTGFPATQTLTISPAPYYFSEIVGVGNYPDAGSTDGPLNQAMLNHPVGLAADAAGDVYIADTGNDTIRKITLSGGMGTMTTVAGQAGQTGGADGLGSAAWFNAPQGVAVGPSGNVYVADTANDTIRMISPVGAVSTIAGQAGQAGDTDGVGANARFNNPTALAVDGSGNVYVLDTGNDTIRVISSAGVVSTLAGTPGQEGTADGTGGAAQFLRLGGIACGKSGPLYVLDWTGIRQVSTAGVVKTVATSVGGDTAGDKGLLGGWTMAVAVDSSGDLFGIGGYEPEQSDTAAVMWEITASGTPQALDISGAVTLGRFGQPYPAWGGGIAVDPSGDIFLTGANTIAEAVRVSGPTISTAATQAVATGQSTVVSVTASGTPGPLTYQWQYDGVNIPGATGATLSLPTIGTNQAGDYTVVVTNSVGDSITSNATAVSVNSNAWLTNLSARAEAQVGNAPQDALVGGFVTTGSASKSILIRADGPALSAAPFDMADALPDPLLTLYNSTGATTTTAASWDPSLAATFAAVGAFPWAVGSSDAAILQSFEPGPYTAGVTPADGQPGVSLVEVYDANDGAPENRLVNLSARANCGTGDQIIIGGFAITGTTSETVLVRAVGPALANSPFNLPGVLLAPVLTVFDSAGNVIAGDQGWANPWTLGPSTVAAGIQTPTTALMASTGAFALPTGSADDALVLTLPPGTYTAEVSGSAGSTGLALVEIYEVP